MEFTQQGGHPANRYSVIPSLWQVDAFAFDDPDHRKRPRPPAPMMAPPVSFSPGRQTTAGVINSPASGGASSAVMHVAATRSKHLSE